MREHLREVDARIEEIEKENRGAALKGDALHEVIALRKEREETERVLAELGLRKRRIQAIHREQRAQNLEGPIRAADPVAARDLTSRQTDALRVVESLHQDGLRDRAAERLDYCIREDSTGQESDRISALGDSNYKSAFVKIIGYGGPQAINLMLSDKEREAFFRVQERALVTAGNVAVPIQLDPSVVPSSSSVFNPIRDISRVETVTSNEWKGVVSAGVSAAYVAEGTESTDDSPTLSQPSIKPQRAQAFVPFSIEIGQDWGALADELAVMFGEAKDKLEAEKFIKGLGDSSNEPEGLLVGGTAFVETAASSVLAIGDVYACKQALGPRWQPRAVWVGHGTTFDRVKRFTGPGSTESSIWNDQDPQILRRAAFEASEMPSSGSGTALTGGATVLTYGDFANFLIADRWGSTIEILPHLLGSNRRPTGQRGAYFYWRSSSKVLAQQAFKSVKVKA